METNPPIAILTDRNSVIVADKLRRFKLEGIWPMHFEIGDKIKIYIGDEDVIAQVSKVGELSKEGIQIIEATECK